MGYSGTSMVSARDREHFRRIAEFEAELNREAVESIFEARAAAGDPLDWGFLDHWAEAWGISDRLEPYRVRFRP